jgi:hypothetical protein
MMERELAEKSPGVAMRQQLETFCVEFISDLILRSAFFTRVSKDGRESTLCGHPSRRLRSLSSGRVEPVIGRAFARPVGADPVASSSG